MSGRALVLIGNAFVVAYAADAGLSVFEEMFRLATGSGLLLPLRNGLANAVVLSSALILPTLLISPRLPGSVLAPLALSALWLGLGAAPLPMLFEGNGLTLVLLCVQPVLVALGLVRIRFLTAGRGWLLGEETARLPAFSLQHFALALGVTLFVGLPLAVAYLPVWLFSSIHVATDGFVSFDLEGVTLADRVYERDGQEVRLVGMMHIGENDAYQALVEIFATPSTVVLAEGVTDRHGLLQIPPSYEGAAQALGLDAQGAIESYLDELEPPTTREWPEVRRADVDLSSFDPETVAWLSWVGEVWDGDDVLDSILRLQRHREAQPRAFAVASEDILDRRNLHLLEELRGALAEYQRVIVPWGALHLPFIQQQLLEMDFAATRRTRHRLVSWGTVAAALQGAPGRRR